ncbi:MAG: 2-amino-4-hydroxy-6-hydroxymethyldihydropteridine diphosphokinase [Candidatus Omnitrophica bacterium]|nr:2-amino-4-hydroxy-6-hydroxymethyldihydropteridine diphosphokinase [Candidatus Omnitrophota bacterium]
MITAYIGIGSNLGDRQANIDTALVVLEHSGKVRITRRSSIYETEPVGGPPQGKYLNGVIEIETDLMPYDLLNLLKGIERNLGRVPNVRCGARVIDLDILLYGDVKVDDEALTIPHPRMNEREFVLRGLREIDPHREGLKTHY